VAPDALIEARLVEIDAALGLRGRYRDRVIAEIRAHLLDATDAAVARGQSHQEAIELAVAELGPPEALAERFTPHATAFTRACGAAPVAGILLGVVAWRLLGPLHANGGRLGSSIPYTAACILAWVSTLLVFAPVVALVVRHRGRLGRSGRLGTAALVVTALAAIGFHFANDGTLNRGPDPDVWRVLLILLSAAGILGLSAMVRRTRLISFWPLAIVGCGIALVVVHYVALNDGGTTAALGLVLVAVGGAAVAGALGRERPLA
jgi:hypothetical protein